MKPLYHCPHCGSTSKGKVKDIRTLSNGALKRVRQCASCKSPFRTIEVTDVFPESRFFALKATAFRALKKQIEQLLALMEAVNE